jgi:hypothetical protein
MPLSVFNEGSTDAADAFAPRAVGYVKLNRLTYIRRPKSFPMNTMVARTFSSLIPSLYFDQDRAHPSDNRPL